MANILIAPSMLACDFGRLAEEVKAVETAGADWLHLDVMDGHFAPNISFGPVVIQAIRKATRLPLDAQLMIEHPERYVDAFIDAGVNHLTVHVEAAGLREPETLRRCLRELRRRKVKAGLSLRPATPADALMPYLEELDLILVMTVIPGFGGQAFMPDQLDKIRALRRRFSGVIGVDGGITQATAPLAIEAGATMLVAGTYVFKHASYREAIASLRPSTHTGVPHGH